MPFSTHALRRLRGLAWPLLALASATVIAQPAAVDALGRTPAIATVPAPVGTLAAPSTSRNGLSDADLRGLFIVERPPLDGFFGVLITRPTWQRNPNVACWVRAHHPTVLTMADEEGGEVAYVPGITPPPAPKDAKAMRPSAFDAQVAAAAQGLHQRCLDIDLAPVADIDDNGHPVRGYDPDPVKAATWAARFATVMVHAGITPVLKHYPGRAGICRRLAPGAFPGLPTHTEVDRCAAPAEAVWAAADAFPVHAVTVVMLANRIYDGVSPTPAVLDPIYTRRLRQRFGGLVITDAIWALNAEPSTIVQAMRSADVIMVPSEKEMTAALPAIRAALADGRLQANDVRASLERARSVREHALQQR